MRPILLQFSCFFVRESFRICPFVPDVFMVLGSFARILRLITAYFPYFNIYFALLSRQMPCLWQPFGNIFRKSREILWQLSYLRGYFYKYNRRNASYCRFIPPLLRATCVVCITCVAFVSLLAFINFLDFFAVFYLFFFGFSRFLLFLYRF